MPEATLAIPYFSRSKLRGFPCHAAYPIAMASIGATTKKSSSCIAPQPSIVRIHIKQRVTKRTNKQRTRKLAVVRGYRRARSARHGYPAIMDSLDILEHYEIRKLAT